MNVTSKMSEQKLEAVVDNGLIEACKDGNTAAVLTLIRAGQDPNVMMTVDNDNVTALMLAAERGDETMVQCLLEAGADWQAQDTTGHTAGEYAMGNTRD